MAFRLQKRVSIAPDAKLNTDKNVSSTTMGKRGASVNAGIPGTDRSYRTKASGSNQRSANNLYNHRKIKPISRAVYQFCRIMAVVLLIMFSLVALVLFTVAYKAFGVVVFLVGLFFFFAIRKSASYRYSLNFPIEDIKDNLK